jgi:hypothetical protein
MYKTFLPWATNDEAKEHIVNDFPAFGGDMIRNTVFLESPPPVILLK